MSFYMVILCLNNCLSFILWRGWHMDIHSNIYIYTHTHTHRAISSHYKCVSLPYRLTLRWLVCEYVCACVREFSALLQNISCQFTRIYCVCVRALVCVSHLIFFRDLSTWTDTHKHANVHLKSAPHTMCSILYTYAGAQKHNRPTHTLLGTHLKTVTHYGENKGGKLQIQIITTLKWMKIVWRSSF